MPFIKDTALIIEGGSMRGAFSAAIINYFIEKQLDFPYVAGISAGSSLATCYLLKEPDRTKKAFIDIAEDPRFSGFRYFLQGKGYFHSHFIYHVTKEKDELLPLRPKKLLQTKTRFQIGATEMKSGTIHYFTNEDLSMPEDILTMIQASSSLPLLMPKTTFQGIDYVDGGVQHGIAYDKAKKDGYKKFVVLLTRDRNYIKPPQKHQSLIKIRYRKYPNLVQQILTRHERYNALREEIFQGEKDGNTFIICPDKMEGDGLSSNREYLEGLYQKGYETIENLYPKLLTFLNL